MAEMGFGDLPAATLKSATAGRRSVASMMLQMMLWSFSDVSSGQLDDSIKESARIKLGGG